MKKTNALLLTAFTSFAMMSPTMIHALEPTVIQNGTSTAEVYKYVQSTYSTYLPKTLELSQTNVTSFEVSAIGNLNPNNVLSITLTSNEITMSRQDDPTYSKIATIEFEDPLWKEADVVELKGASGKITFEETKAGYYTGTMEFKVDLKTVPSTQD